MALKDLLVHVDRTPGALVRLRMAADLARRHGSRMTVLYVRELDPLQLHDQSTAEFGLVSAADINRDNRRILHAEDETVRRLDQELAKIRSECALEVELRSIPGVASTVVPQHARFADLCIVGQDTPGDGLSPGYTFSETVLFSSGRPVLFIPTGEASDTLGRHLLIAWNSSRASARSLNDALPLVEHAEQTTVLAINPTEYIERHRALAPEQIVAHIRRHSASAEGLQLENVDTGSIAEVVQAQARRLGADLVVAGAFGHPKLWERLMGGVTRDLLARMTLPILMSH